MADSSKAKLMMEQGQNFTAMAALTDSGDHITFNSTAGLWSQADGKNPSIIVNGLKSGGLVTVGTGNNNVAAAASIVNLNGVADTTVAADATNSITRAATNVSKVNSITVNSSGVYAVVVGTDGASAAFSETRGAAGGPPYIPVDSIEIAQVRTTTSAAAAITSAEIYQVINTHLEKADYPLYTVDYENGDVVFADALPLIHTGDVTKAVQASFYTALMVELPNVSDATLPENTHSVSSQQIYNGTIASASSSLGQGGFTQFGGDGHTDPILALKNQKLWFKLFSDRNKTPYSLCQGKMAIARQFNAGAQNAAVCTITAESIGTDHAT